MSKSFVLTKKCNIFGKHKMIFCDNTENSLYSCKRAVFYIKMLRDNKVSKNSTT